MYRIPANLDLKDIVGSAIHFIGLGKYQIQFHFYSGRTIYVESKIELWRNEQIVSTWNEKDQWSNQLVQDLLEVKVRNFQVQSETVLAIDFDNGYTLWLYDDSDQFESMQIEPGTIII